MSQSVRAKKWLGQHFLRDEGVAKRIAGLVPNPSPGGHLLEIGPGTGALSRFLPAKAYDRILLVDVDAESIAYLQTRFAQPPFAIIEGDFLTMALPEVLPIGSVVCGNLPYNISSQIFFRILEHRDRISDGVSMVQHEVAHRLCTPAGTRDSGILTVLLQTWYDCTYHFKVGPAAFRPPPAVDSAVISIRRNSRTSLPVPERFYKSVVKLAFGQRRKVLSNALAPMIYGHALPDEFARARAEQLTIDSMIALAQILYAWRPKGVGEAPDDVEGARSDGPADSL